MKRAHTPGQIAYELDVKRMPTYDDRAPRKPWKALDAVARESWERNPTAREYQPEPLTPVVFRVMRDGGDLLALFPTIPADHRGNVTCYAHIGQHSSADYDHCIATSRRATPEEYAPLARELTQIGYRLRVIWRRDSRTYGGGKQSC